MLEHRARTIATAFLVVMTVAALRVLADIPLDKPLAIHFDAAGNANGWAPAWLALAIMPLAALGILLLSWLLPAIDPRGANLLRSRPAVETIVLAVLGLLTAIQLLIAAQALSLPVPVSQVVATMVGLLFIVTGNVMGKLRWNHTVGIRTPWTLANERVWDKTHRFAGWLFVAAGAIIAASAWWSPVRGHEAAVIVVGTAVVAVLPVLRSYQLWKEQHTCNED